MMGEVISSFASSKKTVELGGPTFKRNLAMAAERAIFTALIG